MKVLFAVGLTVHLCLAVRLEQPIDLGRPYDENTINWPGSEPFRFTSQYAGYSGDVWTSINNFATSEHCGTHLDAPYHFNKDGKKVGEIPLRRLLPKGILVNASVETNSDPSYRLPTSKLIQWERENGPIPNNTVILITYGWSHRYPNRRAYLGPSEEDLSFPGLSREAAHWIADKGTVVGVGVDTASVDPAKTAAAHVILSSHDIYNLEHVDLSHSLPPVFRLIVMPMKIANGTGAPCRVIALP